MKLKQYEVTTQPQYLKEPLQDILKRYQTIKKWAYILHDKDKDASPHYHIYVNFGNSSVESKLVAEWFGIAENYVEKVKGRSQDMLLYLIHGNDSQCDKYQYSPDEVVSNFDFKSEIAKAKILGNFEKYSYAKQLLFVNSLPIDEKPSAMRKLDMLWKVHCTCESLENNRDIKVMFIDGCAGSGKTYYAKKLLDDMDYDYAVSSSSNDPFQDYLGQDAIILDDLRDDAFSFADLLKILDNNTASSSKSRFTNKVFRGKMIVITSSVPLRYWYKSIRYEKKDDFGQLCRRISCYVHVTNDLVTVYTALDNDGNPIGEFKQYENEVKELKKQKKTETFDFFNLFSKVCKPVETVIHPTLLEIE